MPVLRESPVPLEEHPSLLTPRGVRDWDAVNVFLHVIRHGSFRAAAERLGQSVNALRRRIDTFEHELGIKLLTRHVDGVRPTAEGQAMLAAAERMELASYDLLRARAQGEPAIAGEVKLAVTEGLGTFWVSPRLVDFQRAFPRLLVDMRCAMESADVLRMEADAGVQLTRPLEKDLKIVKLGRLHVIPFAAESYIDTYGIPRDIPSLLKHRIVLQVAEGVTSLEEYERLFPGVPQLGFVAMRTNVTSAHYWSIAMGAGIGMLPTYMYAIGARVLPIEIKDVYLPVDIWLTYHPDSGQIPRVRRLIDWMVEAFSPQRYPWFRDEFIHPKELLPQARGQHVVNPFESFVAMSATGTRR
jgi:DNA-binding transcriptional LysR family regulator